MVASDELLRAAEHDATTRAVYPDDVVFEMPDGRKVPIGELPGVKTQGQKKDAKA